MRRDIMNSLDISSHISWRFAETTVQSVLVNDADESRQIDFEMRIPSAAFISNFTMLSGGRLLVAEVLERGKALEVCSVQLLVKVFLTF